MPPIRPSSREEADFMNNLLASLDDGVTQSTNQMPARPPREKGKFATPKSTPKKGRTPCKHTRTSPSKVFSAGDIDLEALLDGAEDWDLDMESYVLTPKKNEGQKVALPAVSRPPHKKSLDLIRFLFLASSYISARNLYPMRRRICHRVQSWFTTTGMSFNPCQTHS